MGFTPNQWAILALVLVLGWLLGMLSHSGGARWKRSYEEERIARRTAEDKVARQQERIKVLERETAGRPIGPTTAASVGAAAAGNRDDLALIRGVGRDGETRLNDVGIHRYRQIADLSDGDAELLEDKIGLKRGTVAYEEWREQAALLRDRKLDEHRSRYAAVA